MRSRRRRRISLRNRAESIDRPLSKIGIDSFSAKAHKEKIMKRSLPLTAIAALAFAAAPAHATLPKGATAPTFVAQGAQAGKPMTFDLAKALKKGPVVLYFFPAAFTPGCNIEAQTFAKAMPKFRAAGATVIGVTAGNVDQLKEFSAKKCAGQFPVAAASAKIKAEYDVDLKKPDGTSSGWTNRTTYVIAPNDKIAMVYSAMKPEEHITNSLAAVEALKKG
jgi:peroxiredoxin